MRTKITVTLLVLNAALFSYIFFLEDRFFGPGDPSDHSRKIFHSEAANIDYLKIEGSNLGASHVLERRRDEWRLTSPVDWPANYHAVSRILHRIEYLERETSFSVAEMERHDQTLGDYGLEEPGMTLTFGHGERRHELRFGAATEIGNRLYVLDPAGNRIHVVRRDIVGALATPLDELRSDSIFDIPLFEVRNLTLQVNTPESLKLRVVRSGDSWVFETPIQVPADERTVEATVSGLGNLRVLRFEGEISGDLSPYGLDNPSMRITIDGNMRSQSLLVGNEVPESSGAREYYAKMPRRSKAIPTVFTVDADRIDVLKRAKNTLRDRDFLRLDTESLSSISVAGPDREPVSLQRLETGQWQLVTRQPDQSLRLLPADSSIVERMIQRLADVRARSFEHNSPTEADKEDFGLIEPQRTVTLSGEEDVTLRLGYFSKTRANELYAKTEDAEFVYTVDSSILDALPLLPQFYRDRLLMSRPDGARITSVTIYSLDTDREIFTAELPSRDSTWEEALEDETEETKSAFLALLPELRQLRVQNYILDEFPPILSMGRENRSWIYVVETTFALTGGEEDQTTYFELYLTDRMGGQNMLAGSPELNVVFSARQNLIDAVSTIIEKGEGTPAPAEDVAPATGTPEASEEPAQS